MNIIKKSGNLTMAEMYRLTKSPEIAKLSTVKGQEIEIERFLVHEDPDQNGEIVTVAAFATTQGELFATNSRTFTRDFWKLEVGGASRDPTGFGALEEGLISS